MKADLILILLSSLLLLSLGITIFLLPVSSFSERENRALTTWRAPTWQTLADGSFGRHLSDFYTDQFPLRASFTLLKAYTERALGKGENNGILFGKNGVLIGRDEYESLTVAEQNLAALQAFIEQSDLPVVTMIAPRSIDVNRSKLPTFFDTSYADKIWAFLAQSGVSCVIPTERLQAAAEQGERVWYKTDHHWSTRGAYLAYTELADVLGVQAVSEDQFKRETVSTSFLGTAFSSVGGVATEPDTIELYRYADDGHFTVRNEETGESRTGFYDWDALGKKDQYTVFLGGNAGHLSVRDPSDTAKPRMLLIKDSFANCLVPFLALHFDLDLIDLRYYTQSTRTRIEQGDYDQILIVQGADTLATDASLRRIGY